MGCVVKMLKLFKTARKHACLCNTDAQTRMMGLALDSSRQKLYYTDEGDDAKIAEVSADGSDHRVVLRQRGMKPRAVVLCEEYRQVVPAFSTDTVVLLAA